MTSLFLPDNDSSLLETIPEETTKSYQSYTLQSRHEALEINLYADD